MDLLDEMTRKRAIRRIAPTSSEFHRPAHYLPVFPVAKASGGHRLVVDARSLNEHLEAVPFRCETINTAASLVMPNDFLFGWDLADAYLTLPLHPSQRHLCRLIAPDHSVYEVLVVFFGAAPSPRIFTEMADVPLRLLRAQGLRLSSFLDDSLLATVANQEQAAQQLSLALGTFLDLGFAVHPRKLRLSLSHSATHLGATLDSHAMSVRLPAAKLQRMRRLTRSFTRAATAPARTATLGQLYETIGFLNWTCLALVEGPLHLRPLNRWRSEFLRALSPCGSWRRVSTTLLPSPPADVLTALSWFASRTARDAWAPLGRLSPLPPPTRWTLTTDASPYGVGATLQRSHPADHSASNNTDSTPPTTPVVWQFHGQLSPTDQQQQQNVREARALEIALQQLLHAPPVQLLDRRKRFTPLQVQTDNRTLVSHINRSGGRSAQVSTVAERILRLAFQQRVLLVATYIPAALNTTADRASRLLAASEWALHPTVWARVCSQFGTPTLDLFASSRHHLCPRWVSPAVHAEAWATDALRLHWPSLRSERAIAVPPVPLIGPFLASLLSARHRPPVMLVAPFWPGCRWWPLLAALLQQPPTLLVSPLPTQPWDTRYPPPPASCASYSRWRWALFQLSSC
jgi:hypothetical protein